MPLGLGIIAGVAAGGLVDLIARVITDRITGTRVYVWPRRCQHQQPPLWYCTRPDEHEGNCHLRVTLRGRVIYGVKRLRVWPTRLLARIARHLAHRCPQCGRREHPQLDNPCRHCGYPLA